MELIRRTGFKLASFAYMGPRSTATTQASGASPAPVASEAGDKKRIAQCNCGQLRVTVTGPDPERISLCHCNLCQKQSGNIFAVQARFPTEQVAIEGKSTSWKLPKDEADQIAYRNCVSLGGGAVFHFCPESGSLLDTILHFCCNGIEPQ